MTEAKKNYLRAKRFPLYRYKFRGGKYKLRQNMNFFDRTDSFDYQGDYKWLGECKFIHTGQFWNSSGYQWWVKERTTKGTKIKDCCHRIGYLKEIRNKLSR